MASGTKDDPIKLETLMGFQPVPNHWYLFKDVKFTTHYDGGDWVDENGVDLEVSGDSWL